MTSNPLNHDKLRALAEAANALPELSRHVTLDPDDLLALLDESRLRLRMIAKFDEFCEKLGTVLGRRPGEDHLFHRNELLADVGEIAKERDQLPERVAALGMEIGEWKDATELVDAHGDPDGVTPGNLRQRIGRDTARAAKLELGLVAIANGEALIAGCTPHCVCPSFARDTLESETE